MDSFIVEDGIVSQDLKEFSTNTFSVLCFYLIAEIGVHIFAFLYDTPLCEVLVQKGYPHSSHITTQLSPVMFGCNVA
jgi:hypothetical protein